MSISFRGCPYSAENYYISTMDHYKNQDQITHRVNRIDFRFRSGSSEGTLFQGRSDNDSKKHIIAALHESK